MKKRTLTADAPPRQGFYEAQTRDGTKHVAEWREKDKKEGKRWWQYLSDDPTVAKTAAPLDDVVGWRPIDKARVEQHLQRALTLEERIRQAYEAYRSHHGLYDFTTPAPPSNRQLVIGDAIEVGNLKDCVVVGLEDEGRAVIYEFHNLRSVYGREVDSGISIQASHWTEVVPLKTRKSTAMTRSSLLYGGYRNSTLSSLLHRWVNGVNDNPDYQRGYAWSLDDKQRYLESLFEGRELGRFVFVERPYPARDEVLDGKQRMNCLAEFFMSRLPYSGVYWHELSARDRCALEGRSVQYADLPGDRYSRADLLSIFLEVNAGGVPQTEEHLAKVRALLEAERLKAA